MAVILQAPVLIILAHSAKWWVSKKYWYSKWW